MVHINARQSKKKRIVVKKLINSINLTTIYKALNINNPIFLYLNVCDISAADVHEKCEIFIFKPLKGFIEH